MAKLITDEVREAFVDSMILKAVNRVLYARHKAAMIAGPQNYEVKIKKIELVNAGSGMTVVVSYDLWIVGEQTHHLASPTYSIPMEELT